MKEEDKILNAKLLSQLKAGEEQALVDIIDLYRKQLTYYAYYLLDDLDEADDIMQEVFFKLWHVKDKLAPTTCLEKYLTTLTRNHCISALRKNKTRRRLKESFYYELPRSLYVDELENAELGERIASAIQSLTASQQKIFQSVYFEGKTHMEVMKENNIKLPTVKVTIHSALKILRAKLHDMIK